MFGSGSVGSAWEHDHGGISPILWSDARPWNFRRAPILWYDLGDLPFTIHHPLFKAKAHSIAALWAERGVKSGQGTCDQTNEHKADGSLIHPPPGSDSYDTFYQSIVPSQARPRIHRSSYNDTKDTYKAADARTHDQTTERKWIMGKRIRSRER